MVKNVDCRLIDYFFIILLDIHYEFVAKISIFIIFKYKKNILFHIGRSN